MRSAALLSLILLHSHVAFGQSLPPPSRTIYKCEQGKKVSYSDEPCVGAKALDIVVPRGMDKLSGTQRKGQDVASEEHRENFANALKPLSGMTPEQLAVFSRRQKLSGAMQLHCKRLDMLLPQLEAREHGLAGEALLQAQTTLYQSRKQYKSIGC